MTATPLTLTTKKFDYLVCEPLSIFLPRLDTLKTQAEKLEFVNMLQEMFTIGEIGKIISYDFRNTKENDRYVGFIDLKLYKTLNAMIFKKAIVSSPHRVLLNDIEIQKYVSKVVRDSKKIKKNNKKDKQIVEDVDVEDNTEYNFEFSSKQIGNSTITIPVCNGLHKKDWTPSMYTAYNEWIETTPVDNDEEAEWDKKNAETFGEIDDDEEADYQYIKELCDLLSTVH